MNKFNKKNRTAAKYEWIILVFIIIIFALGMTAGTIINKIKKYDNKNNKSNSKNIKSDDSSYLNIINQENSVLKKQNKKNQPETIIAIPNHEGYLVAIYKENHKLKLYKNNKIIKTYPVNLRSELADRRIWRDDQTPEGIFHIEDMAIVTNGWSRWMRLNTLEKAKKIYIQSYNNGENNIKTFETKYGKISTDEDIRQFNRVYPNQKMLRGIGIHGGGYIKGNDWTIGCIALNDEDVIELYNMLVNSNNEGIGTTVIIQD